MHVEQDMWLSYPVSSKIKVSYVLLSCFHSSVLMAKESAFHKTSELRRKSERTVYSCHRVANHAAVITRKKPGNCLLSHLPQLLLSYVEGRKLQDGTCPVLNIISRSMLSLFFHPQLTWKHTAIKFCFWVFSSKLSF